MSSMGSKRIGKPEIATNYHFLDTFARCEHFIMVTGSCDVFAPGATTTPRIPKKVQNEDTPLILVVVTCFNPGSIR